MPTSVSKLYERSKRICVDPKGFNGKSEKVDKNSKKYKKHLLFYKVYYIIILRHKEVTKLNNACAISSVGRAPDS